MPAIRVVTVTPNRMPEALRAFRELTGSPAPMLKAIGVRLVRWVDDNFARGGDPPWAPLRPWTLSARRAGPNPGRRAGTLPLQGLRHTVDAVLAEPTRLDVVIDSPVASYHEGGTRGPYTIRPRTAKALALPAPPGSAGGAGRLSFAGLGRSRRTRTGALVFRPGGRTPRRFRGREGRTVSPFTNLLFRRSVTHPGLPQRRMLPTVEQAEPIVVETAERFLDREVQLRLRGS